MIITRVRDNTRRISVSARGKANAFVESHENHSISP